MGSSGGLVQFCKVVRFAVDSDLAVRYMPAKVAPYHSMTEKKTAVYFRISEAAHMLGISASSLRNWERMGLITAARSQGAIALLREGLKKLRKIKYLRTVQHVNPAGIVAILQGKQENERAPPRRSINRKRSRKSCWNCGGNTA